MIQLPGSLLARASWRNVLRHPWMLGLLILGVALGVSVVVAVDLANESASRAFRLSVESVTGNTTHQIVSGPTGFDESLYTDLRTEYGLRNSAPVVEGYVQVRDETLRLMGLDPFAELGFRDQFGSTTRGNAERLLTEPDTVLLAQVTAERLGIRAGDSVTAGVPGRQQEMTVIGLLVPSDQPAAALEGLMVTDIATAQETLGKVGRLDRIDLILPNPERTLPPLEAWLPAGVTVITADAGANATAQMTDAFETNLTAMSFLALVVGMFLIYNTMTFSVLQRRWLIGTLRVLGATRQEVFRQVIIEAFSIGLIGTVLGLGLGFLLAQGLINLVTNTINDLYFVLQVSDLLVSPIPFLKGLALGIGAAVLAAIPPAIEAACSPPQTTQRRSVVEYRARGLVRWVFAGGLVCMLLAWALLDFSDKSLLLGFGALFLLILGFSLATPVPTLIFSWLASHLFGRAAGILGNMSARGVSNALSRTGISIAALAVAVSATIGTGVMIGSFRSTVDDWIGQTLQSDVYVTAPHPVASRVDGTLPAAALGRLDAVESYDEITLRRVVQVQATEGTTQVLAIRPPEATFRNYDLKQGDADALWSRFESGQVVLVSEPYAYRNDVSGGDPVRLLTADGYRDFTVGGVFYDYSADQGMVMIHLDTYQDHWNDSGISSVGLNGTAGQPPEVLIEAVREALAGVPQVLIRPAGEIREISMDVFDRTFTITNVLRILAVTIAFVGVLSAMMALQLERTRELGVLRATGVTPRQLWGMVVSQTGLMGLIAGVLAIPLGLVMSSVLIDVINIRSFGWSMRTVVPWEMLGQAVLLAIGAALLAGVYPAWRMARTSPAMALREE